MLFLGWLLSEVVEITNWGARLPQNRFGWRWLLFEELWTPSLVGVEPPTQLWFYFIQAVIPLLDHRDKDVREEGKKLIIESYRWIGNTSHLLIILSDRVFHLLLDRAQFKKLGFLELLENFKTLNHSKKNCLSCMQKLKGSSSILCLIWRLSIEIIQYDMGHCKSAYNEKLINSFNHEILRFLKHYLFYI